MFRFANTDYALAMGLQLHRGVKWVDHTYDINCQYEKKFETRVQKNFPSLLDDISELRFWIPSMHVIGHNEDCQYRYALAYAPGVGRTHGEGIETCWAEQNQTGGMTKEMNHGHRHDTLDDFSGDWNWLKTQQMGESQVC